MIRSKTVGKVLINLKPLLTRVTPNYQTSPIILPISAQFTQK